MAVNNDRTNKLYSVNDTGVKFFSSLTRNQAKGIDKFIYEGQETDINSFPGAICYVSDDKGNSIFLNKLLFGDGAVASGTTGGSPGITEVSLDIIPVIEKDGNIIKTLADYFQTDGTFISEKLVIYENKQNEDGVQYKESIIVLNKDGITINNSRVLTSNDRTQLEQNIATAEQNAKDYADSKLSSIYTIQGSIDNLNDLKKISNPQIGWVYNVVKGVNNLGEANYIPPGTNFVWNGEEWDPLGGTIDLSAYKTASATSQEIEAAEQSAKNYTDQKLTSVNNLVEAHGNALTALNNVYNSLSEQQSTQSQNIQTNTTNIQQNTQNITQISTQLTWQ